MELSVVAESCGIIIVIVFTTVICGSLIHSAINARKESSIALQKKELEINEKSISQLEKIERIPFLKRIMMEKIKNEHDRVDR